MNIVHTVEELGPLAGTGVTIGNFDGVHKGHQVLIRRTLDVCRQKGHTCVVLTFWPHPRLVLFPERGHMPLTSREDRLELLAGLGVEHVLELPFTHELAAFTPEQFARACLLPLNIRRLEVGHDFTLGRGRSGHIDVLRDLGARLGFVVEQLPPVIVDGVVVSSTHLRELISAGDVDRAARLLGRCHGFSGEVVHGDGRGSGLGFPTANLLRPGVLLPAEGVYATRAKVDGRADGSADGPCWRAVTNVGRKPTFGGAELGVESFLLDDGEDLYGRRLRLEFVARLRGERRFDSADALKEQIGLDVDEARRILGEEDVRSAS